MANKSFRHSLSSNFPPPTSLFPTKERHYGYGLSISEVSGVRWLSHSGSRTGYGSLVKMCPKRNVSRSSFFCNKTGLDFRQSPMQSPVW